MPTSLIPERMPSIQLSLLHHLLGILKRLRTVGDKLWKLGTRQVLFLRKFFRGCLSLFIGRFRNWKQISSRSRRSLSWDKANHDSDDVPNNVDSFSRLPPSLRVLSGWSRSQSLPLYQVEHDSHPDPELQTGPSTSQAVVPYSMTSTDMRMSPLSSVTAKEKDHHNGHSHLPQGPSKEIEMLVGITSVEFERYERNFKSKKIHYEGGFAIDPMHMTFEEPELPNSWVAYTHPDGAPYFLDDSRKLSILTDVWMYDTDSNVALENYIRQIFSYIEKYQIEMPEETYLVLEFRNSGNCGYYFVNHAKQCLFWLDEYNAMDFLYEVQVDYTPSHIGNEMKSLYWCHNHLFPNIRPLPSSAILEIKDILIHAVGDSLTSTRSVVPYSLDELRKMLDLVNNIEAQDKLAAGSFAIISRFLQNFYHERFLHLHGQKIARLNRDQSIHPERQRTFVMKVMSPFLLYAPEVYLRKLSDVTIDCLLNKPVWDDLLGNLTADWKEFTLYATVLLNANVAFLAIQSVDSGSIPGHRSSAQRASYFSIVTSVGAIVLGLLLAREHNTTLNSSFIVNRSVSVYGLETLALMYSLPYALLMWGMVSFLVAFSIMCFSSSDKITIVMMSITWLALCSLLLWCISVSYESQPFLLPWPFRQWRWLKDLIKEGIDVGKGKVSMHRIHNDKSLSESSPQS